MKPDCMRPDVRAVVSCASRFTGRDYQVALALQEAGKLQRFVTGLYMKTGSLVYALARSQVLPRSIRGKLLDRRAAGLDDRRVLSIPFLEPASLMGRWLLRFNPTYAGRWARRLVDMHDLLAATAIGRMQPRPTVVVSFEGGALRLFRTARELDIRCILDVGSAHEEFVRIIEEEQRRHPRVSGRDDPRDTAQVRAERDLADCILVPSFFVRQSLIANGVPSEKMVTIPYGYDPVAAQPRISDVSSPESRFLVLSVASINRRKGTEYLLEAWRQCGFTDGELILIGTPDFYGRDVLRKFEGVHRWIGQIPNREIVSWLAAADVFALASLAEGSSLAVFEAMASGLPVVVTDACGAVARHGIDGFVVPRGDVNALAEALRYMHDHRSEARAMGRSATHLIETQFSWRKYRRRVAAVCSGISQGKSPREMAEDLRGWSDDDPIAQ